VNALEGQISLARPLLPPFLERVKISNLNVGHAVVDFLVVRHEHDISINVLQQTGHIEVVVLPG